MINEKELWFSDQNIFTKRSNFFRFSTHWEECEYIQSSTTFIIHHNVSAERCTCAELSEILTFKTEENPVGEIIQSLRLISSPECVVQQGMMNVLCQVTLWPLIGPHLTESLASDWPRAGVLVNSSNVTVPGQWDKHSGKIFLQKV